MVNKTLRLSQRPISGEVPMTTAAGELSSTIAAAIKELAALTKELTNLVGVIKKNVEAYWAIKDAAARRTASANIMSLSRQFSQMAIPQGTMEMELDYNHLSKRAGFDDEKYVAKVAERLDNYTNKVDETMRLLKDSFPNLVTSSVAGSSLKALLNKKRVAEQLLDTISQYKLASPEEAILVIWEIRKLITAFDLLSRESIEIARLTKTYAEKMKG
jgi:hypothetical protein